MQAVILAGGLATRLGDLTRNSPKAMVEVRGRPFLEFQIEMLKRAGIRDLVVCVGHLAQAIMSRFGGGCEYGVRIAYSIEDTPLGTGGALKKAEPLLDERFLLIYGDSFLLADLKPPIEYFQNRTEPALMMVYRNQDSLDRSNAEVDGAFVSRYSKTARTPGMVYIDYGASLYRKEVLSLIPPGQPYPLEKVQEALARERRLLAFEVTERFYEIGNPAGLAEFKSFVELSTNSKAVL